MGITSKRTRRGTSLFVSMAVLLLLVVPFSSTAFGAITTVTISPTSDTAPSGSCNEFTVTLTGDGQTTEVTGQTVDVRVADTDPDDPDTFGDESQSPIRFCTPTTGTNPQHTDASRGAVSDT